MFVCVSVCVVVFVVVFVFVFCLCFVVLICFVVCFVFCFRIWFFVSGCFLHDRNLYEGPNQVKFATVSNNNGSNRFQTDYIDVIRRAQHTMTAVAVGEAGGTPAGTFHMTETCTRAPLKLRLQRFQTKMAQTGFKSPMLKWLGFRSGPAWLIPSGLTLDECHWI